MSTALRWGVLGASSRIYRRAILPPIEASARHEVVAEARRTADGSDAPYGELLTRPDVDAVYIPVPNDGHKPWILAALEAGKHVLCEKPLTMSAADTDEVFAAASSCGRVLVEAYMWPHHPRSRLVLDLAREDLGALRFSHGAFCFDLDRPDDHRADQRGGGALFDVGIYCLGPALLLAPRSPVGVAASAVRNEHDVDLSLSGWLDLGEGFTATAQVSFQSIHRRSLELVGTAGAIRFAHQSAPGPLEPSVVAVELDGDEVAEHPAPGADAYAEMLDQFADVVSTGVAPRWGAAESRLLARWLDALHAASRRG
jgi:D-xylose 1-dehydrogenase (NADP+, D-xylono-1,5-lactone-forming)